jgi:hypothetical protein
MEDGGRPRRIDDDARIPPSVGARELPELPRPLKNWGAPWLVQEILAAREQRLAGPRNRARLGPCPWEPGCQAPAEVLRENGY